MFDAILKRMYDSILKLQCVLQYIWCLQDSVLQECQKITHGMSGCEYLNIYHDKNQQDSDLSVLVKTYHFDFVL